MRSGASLRPAQSGGAALLCLPPPFPDAMAAENGDYYEVRRAPPLAVRGACVAAPRVASRRRAHLHLRAACSTPSPAPLLALQAIPPRETYAHGHVAQPRAARRAPRQGLGAGRGAGPAPAAAAAATVSLRRAATPQPPNAASRAPRTLAQAMHVRWEGKRPHACCIAPRGAPGAPSTSACSADAPLCSSLRADPRRAARLPRC